MTGFDGYVVCFDDEFYVRFVGLPVFHQRLDGTLQHDVHQETVSNRADVSAESPKKPGQLTR